MTRRRKKRLTGLNNYTILYLYSFYLYYTYFFLDSLFFKLKENVNVCECYNVCGYFVGLNILYVYEYFVGTYIVHINVRN